LFFSHYRDSPALLSSVLFHRFPDDRISHHRFLLCAVSFLFFGVVIDYKKDRRILIDTAVIGDGWKLTAYVVDYKLLPSAGWTHVILLRCCSLSQVFGVEWNPYAVDGSGEFITYGRKHIKKWSEAGRAWSSASMSFGKQKMQNVHSVVYLPRKASGTVLVAAGCSDGAILVFKVPVTPPTHLTATYMC
jgi:hypothetical protein